MIIDREYYYTILMKSGRVYFSPAEPEGNIVWMCKTFNDKIQQQEDLFTVVNDSEGYEAIINISDIAEVKWGYREMEAEK